MKRKITPPVAAFKDVAAEAGINWTQVNGANGNMYFPSRWAPAWPGSIGTTTSTPISSSSTIPTEDEGQVRPGFLAAYENDGKGNFKDTEALGLKISLYVRVSQPATTMAMGSPTSTSPHWAITASFAISAASASRMSPRR